MSLESFSLEGKIAIVTGGTGVLGGALARGLAAAGARVGILGRRAEQAALVANEIGSAGGTALPLTADVLDREQLLAARDQIVAAWGGIDILISAAGGNIPEAVVVGDRSFFDLSQDALDQVFRLNLNGSILPAQVFGEVMMQRGAGSIINISSMAAQKPLTRVIGYAAAKAAIDNFTKWLAVELALKYGPALRVNAIAPGFFVGDQNRAMLLNADDSLTPRGQLIIDHTPLRRFGVPDELVGAAIWLSSDAARFVTGIVVPIDGGFSAFGGI
jgi:NAD(P)-dependent dehydrogenase (short-subunit alcohol dehydrogenase family)